MFAGQRIYALLYIPAFHAEDGFEPDLTLMGPGLTNEGTAPAYVDVPEGAGVVAREGARAAEPTYEPFSATAFYAIAEVSLNAPSTGAYYLAVHDPSAAGAFGIAIGNREAFTIDEWIFTPLALLSVYEWTGQNVVLVLLPSVLTVAIGAPLLLWYRRGRPPRSASALGLTFAGLLFVGSGVSVLAQMATALTQVRPGADLSVTVILALIPLLLGFFTLRIALAPSPRWGTRARIKAIALGIIALFAWAGFLVGPLLAIVAAVLPTRIPSSATEDAKA